MRTVGITYKENKKPVEKPAETKPAEEKPKAEKPAAKPAKK